MRMKHTYSPWVLTELHLDSRYMLQKPTPKVHVIPYASGDLILLTIKSQPDKKSQYRQPAISHNRYAEPQECFWTEPDVPFFAWSINIPILQILLKKSHKLFHHCAVLIISDFCMLSIICYTITRNFYILLPLFSRISTNSDHYCKLDKYPLFLNILNEI